MKTLNDQLDTEERPSYVTHEKCEKCNVKFHEDDLASSEIHSMIHMLMNQLKKMPSNYGLSAMAILLANNFPSSKENFMQMLSEAWDCTRD